MPEIIHHCFDELVPKGFDLLYAERDKLDLYGIPQKPDPETEPGLFDFWKTLVSPPFTAVRPTFQTLDQPSSLGSPLQSMLNWSGALMSPPWPNPFFFAAAGWTAPKVRPPSTPAFDADSKNPRSLVWVGFDGHNGMLPNTSLPQIGTAHWPNGNPNEHFAWWDWWHHPADQKTKKQLRPPQAIKMITNLRIRAGNKILAGLAILASRDILYFIKNQSTGHFCSFLVQQPAANIRPLGSSVEWVMERPTNPDTDQLYQLPAYEPVNFKYCLARAANGPHKSGREMTFTNNALLIQMRETFANPYRAFYVSRAALREDPDGSIGVTCTFQDPA